MLTFYSATDKKMNLAIDAEENTSVLLATDRTGYTRPSVKYAIRQAHEDGDKLVVAYFADAEQGEEDRNFGLEVLEEIAAKAKAAGVVTVQLLMEQESLAAKVPVLADTLRAELIVLATERL